MIESQPQITDKQSPGIYSQELLIHFSCTDCKKWWSVGDPESIPTEMFCPWCGTKQAFEENQLSR